MIVVLGGGLQEGLHPSVSHLQVKRFNLLSIEESGVNASILAACPYVP